jgi:hypothetical protein
VIRVGVFIRLPFSRLSVNILMNDDKGGLRGTPHLNLLRSDKPSGIRICAGGMALAENPAGNKSARDHVDGTRTEVIERLQKIGAATVDYCAVLSDDEMDRNGGRSVFSGEVSAGQVAEFVILTSAARHLKSMKTAIDT